MAAVPPIQRVAAVLRRGGVIAYPTEAVWGLGCDPFNADAVHRILLLKRRPVSKGMIVVTGDIADVEPLLAGLKPEIRARVTATWPGPVTWLLPDPRSHFPAWVRGDHRSVAVRVTDHPLVTQLCKEFGGFIVSTSCNRAGRPPLRTMATVRRNFGAQLDDVLPGALGNREQPSPIFDALTGDQCR